MDFGSRREAPELPPPKRHRQDQQQQQQKPATQATQRTATQPRAPPLRPEAAPTPAMHWSQQQQQQQQQQWAQRHVPLPHRAGSPPGTQVAEAGGDGAWRGAPAPAPLLFSQVQQSQAAASAPLSAPAQRGAAPPHATQQAGEAGGSGSAAVAPPTSLKQLAKEAIELVQAATGVPRKQAAEAVVTELRSERQQRWLAEGAAALAAALAQAGGQRSTAEC